MTRPGLPPLWSDGDRGPALSRLTSPANDSSTSCQLAQCERDLKRWEAAYLGEAIDLADFKVKKAEVDARRASADQELAHLDAEQRALEQAELEIKSLMEYCTRVRSMLQHFTLDEKQLALEALNITVTWHPDWPKPKIEGNLPVPIVSNAS
jgi:hypothetical protein